MEEEEKNKGQNDSKEVKRETKKGSKTGGRRVKGGEPGSGPDVVLVGQGNHPGSGAERTHQQQTPGE